MPLSGVTFDLWQTLLMDSQHLGRARMKVRLDGAREALLEAGEEFAEDHIREAYRQCYHTCHDIRSREQDVSFPEQVEIFIRHIDLGLMERLEAKVVKQIATVYADSLFCYPPPPHADAQSILRSVKGKGYRIGLISNTGMTPGVTFRTYMGQTGLLEYFDVLTFSDEVRLAKPSRDIFHLTAQALEIPPDQVVHVGDHLLADVLGAQQAGMKTIWIETHDERRAKADVVPDATVASLAGVDSAIERLALSSA